MSVSALRCSLLLLSASFAPRLRAVRVQAAQPSVSVAVFLDVYDLHKLRPLEAGAVGGIGGSLAGSAAGSYAGSVAGGPIGGSVASIPGASVGASVGAGTGLLKDGKANAEVAMDDIPVELAPYMPWVTQHGGSGLIELDAVSNSSHATRALVHSEVTVCEYDQFDLEQKKYLLKSHYRTVPEDWSENAFGLDNELVKCFAFFFGFSPCNEPLCAVSMLARSIKEKSSPPYGERTRVYLGAQDLIMPGGIGRYRRDYWVPVVLKDKLLSMNTSWMGIDYDFVAHNCNNFARFMVRCILKLKMPLPFRLGINHALSSNTWETWAGGIGAAVAGGVGAAVVGGVALGPLGLLVGPLIGLAVPKDVCT